MKNSRKDKTLSGLLLILSGIVMIYAVYSGLDINSLQLNQINLNFIFNLIDSYLDLIIIAYVFICLQVAGYFELKYKQNYLMVSLISVFLTPISLLFIHDDENEKD